MKSKLFLILFSIAALILLILHMFIPSSKIDLIALVLLVLTFLPWIFPYLKKIELPGGIKIELREVKEAVEKVAGRTINLSGKIHAKSSVTAALSIEQPDSISLLKRVSEHEPNLALVGFRIEIEKKIIRLAEKNKIKIDRSLTRLIKELQKNDILTYEAMSGLLELVAFGNQAAHGAKVSQEAVEWVLDYGPEILASLDDNS
jgi:hypothetical protein